MSAPVLGIFPWLGRGAVGGAQTSGRLAWEGLRAAGPARLFCYGPGATPAELPGAAVAGSKRAAAGLALAGRWRPRAVLIWHIGLLRLLPLFRVGRARVCLMLLGVEAWRRHDPLTRLMLRRVDRFLTISDHTWHRFAACYPELAGRPQRTVHLGLGEPSPPAPPPEGAPAALILGRMARGEGYKGHAELIAAWPRLRERVPGAELWVAGEGDLRPELEREATGRGLSGAVRFFGLVDEARKAELLAGARCLAMPSRGEGFGLVYLEAMRLGRPCLVSPHDAGVEVAPPGEAGLAADPADPAALVAALARLLTPGAEWGALADGARRRYESRFTAAHFQARLVGALLSEGEAR